MKNTKILLAASVVATIITQSNQAHGQTLWQYKTGSSGPIETTSGVTNLELNGNIGFKPLSTWYRELQGSSSHGLVLAANTGWADGAGILLAGNTHSWGKGGIQFVASGAGNADDEAFGFSNNWNKIMSITNEGRVGIGSATPDARFGVNETVIHNPFFPTTHPPTAKIVSKFYTGSSGSPIGMTQPNALEVWTSTIYDTYPIGLPTPGPTITKLGLVVANMATAAWVGINKDQPQATLDVDGTTRSVNAIIGDNLTPLSGDRLTVQGTLGLLPGTSGGYSTIKGNSNATGLVLYGNTSWGDGSGIILNGGGGNKSDINFVTSEGGNFNSGFSFWKSDASGAWTNRLLNITKGGTVNISSLAGSGTRMVVADAGGALSTQSMPTDAQTLSVSGNNISISNGNTISVPAQTLSVTGNDISISNGNTISVPAQTLSVTGNNLSISSGNTVTLPGDNFGDHAASQDINMMGRNIMAAETISARTIALGVGSLSGGGGGIKVSNQLFVKSVPNNSSSLNFFVLGDAEIIGATKIVGNFRVEGVPFTTNTSWTTSDKKFKKNIEKISNVKDRLFQVVPYAYDLKVDEFKDYNFISTRQFGFLAQELEEIFPNMVMTTEKGDKAVNYTEMIPLLLEALKEEDAIINKQQATIAALETKVNKAAAATEMAATYANKLAELDNKMNRLNAMIDAMEQKSEKIAGLENRIAELQSDLNLCCQANKPSDVTGAGNNNTLKSTLEQNVPNPFNSETRIGFSIVGSYKQAYISVSDVSGRLIKTVNIETGMRSITIDRGLLMPGAYTYSLFVDGILIDTKKMVIIE